MKNIAFIPLRGGSTSIPFKNIKLLNGRPLAYYVLDAATQASCFDTVVVATDCPKIGQIIKEYDSDKIMIVGRSPEVSTAEASTLSVMLEFSDRYQFETITLVQATSPLTTALDLKNAWNMMSQGYDSIVSVVRQHIFLWDEETKVPNYDMYNKPRRQDWNGILGENGAFYITTYNNLVNNQLIISGRVGLYEMHPRTRIEIDEEDDWLLMEYLIKQ